MFFQEEKTLSCQHVLPLGLVFTGDMKLLKILETFVNKAYKHIKTSLNNLQIV